MHSLLFCAQSGWGKSYLLQAIIERNLSKFHAVLILDYKDEYRGLCSKNHGPAPFKHWLAGPRERDHFGVTEWKTMLNANPKLVVARSGIPEDEWREAVCDPAIRAARQQGRILVVVDEAHFVAPQVGKLLDGIKGLATTGRGEKASSMWVTQQPSELDETVIGNTTAKFLGGFNTDSDIKKVAGSAGYPAQVHNITGDRVSGLPEELLTPDGEPQVVRKWTDETGEQVTGSEWIYSNDTGELRRINSSTDYDPQCEHVGSSGIAIEV